jgi:hypothetical protein
MPKHKLKNMLQDLLKITLEEKKKNIKVLKEFKIAFLMKNVFEIEELLDEKGLFFNKLEKIDALAYFYKLLVSDPKKTNTILRTEIKQGYSLDNFPGQHVLEIRFINSDPFIYPNVSSYNFGDPPRKFLKEEVIQFAFQLKKGKITEIRIPKKVIESIEKFERYN